MNEYRAYCPICGAESRSFEKLSLDDALCAGRCTAAYEALAALGAPDALNRLGQLLLARWRAGDWTVAPEAVLEQV